MLVKETRCNKLHNVGFRFIKMLGLIYHIWSSSWVVHRKQEPGKNERVNVQFDCWDSLFIRPHHITWICIVYYNSLGCILMSFAYFYYKTLSITHQALWCDHKHHRPSFTVSTVPHPQISRVYESRHFFLINGCSYCRLASDLTHVQKSCDRLTEWLFLITQSWHTTPLDQLVLVTTAHKDKHDIK